MFCTSAMPGASRIGAYSLPIGPIDTLSSVCAATPVVKSSPVSAPSKKQLVSVTDWLRERSPVWFSTAE